MNIKVLPSGESCGAIISGLDLTQALSDDVIKNLRSLWLKHHVLSFPDQKMSDDDLERFTLYFGPFGDDPFIESIPGRDHVIAVERAKNETASVFAEAWHTDWSFQKNPPAGTCLFGLVIPPQGGDTLFANQHLALEKMPHELRARLDGKTAIHSARLAYAPDGAYGEHDQAMGSMNIVPSDSANAIQTHPLVRKHPETGEEGIFGCYGYVIGIEGMETAKSLELLTELHQWQTQDQFQYRHRWQANTLIMWDNRSVLHSATGGYDGYRRLLHRTTIGAY